MLYGSQTGTAQEVAERIGREARRHFFIPTVLPMDDCPLERLTKDTLTVFVAATTGQGDDPDNMRNFFKGLWSQRRNRQLLSNLKFGVLGLGDSSYQKFNYSAKRLNNLLTYLGGQALLKIGLGDDQHDLGPEFVIDPWLENWWNKALQLYPLAEGVQPFSSKITLPPKYKLKVITDVHVDKSNCDKRSDMSEQQGEACALNPCLAKVTRNERVTSEDHFQEVRLIEFDTSQIKSKHKPGDVLMVQPHNLHEHVDEFISVLGLDPNLKFTLQLNDPNATLPLDSVLPTPCTVRECVQKYFDIQAVPKRYFFEVMSYFTKDETEKEKFEEFTTAEGQQALHDYCTRPKRSIMEVLADFPHTNQNIPLEYLFDLLPPIKSRPYSIASSSLAMPNRTQLLVAVVNYNTILRRPRLGLCTNWLTRQKVGSTVPVWVKPGTLTFPSPESKVIPPVVMIGPGTGCAPFRAYIQERVSSGAGKGLVMVFGCRNKTKDYFFKDEWERLAKEDKLELYCAFSRDQEDKVYVQHVMRKHAAHLWHLIGEQGARVYFAGNAKRVPIDVYEALTFICEHGRGGGQVDAEQYMKKEVEKRYQTETWA